MNYILINKLLARYNHDAEISSKALCAPVFYVYSLSRLLLHSGPYFLVVANAFRCLTETELALLVL